MNLSKLREILKNEPGFRVKQVKQAIYRDLLSNWSEATTLSKAMREELEKECSIAIRGQQFKSKDGSIKALLTFDDGAQVESVLMRHKEDRNTVCVSSQVGCPMGCGFCATGAGGFKRNLTADEIVTQVLFFAREMKKTNERVSGVVFMGMGEPFLNYDNVMDAVRLLNDHEGLNIGARHISISTCGIIDGIKRMADEGLEINLAVSLHASNDELRGRLMPVANKYSLEKVLSAVKDYLRKTRRRVCFEYMLIAGVNDSPNDARELGNMLRGLLCFVNIIPYNATGAFESSGIGAIRKFKETLRDEKVAVTERHRFGADIAAACGQLAGRGNKVTR
jgi:23S rRNA (adenine2503-C2)-methyltransferase